MIVFIFGNPDVEEDSLPLQILPELQLQFPTIRFETKDPNEEWNVPEELTVIDTAIGLREVTAFNNLDQFEKATRVSLHDFDALTNLHYLQKLGKLKKIKIIGVPPTITPKDAIEEISKLLSPKS